MNIDELDETYLLQSYNENPFFTLNKQPHEMVPNINIADSILQKPQLDDQTQNNDNDLKKMWLSKEYQDPKQYKLELQNYSSIQLISPSLTAPGIKQKIGQTPEVQMFVLEELEGLSAPKNLIQAHDFIEMMTQKYKDIVRCSEEKSMVIEQLMDLITLQNQLVKGYQNELRYLEKKYIEYNNTIGRTISAEKLKQCLNDSTSHQEPTQVKLNRCANQIVSFFTSYMTNFRNQQKDRMNGQKQMQVGPDENNNSHVSNRDPLVFNHKAYQCNTAQYEITKTQKRMFSDLTCTEFQQAEQQIIQTDKPKNYSSVSPTLEDKFNEGEVDAKLQNYRQITNFRIRQLERQNEGLINQLQCLKGKGIVLKKENSELKDIIECLIREMKIQGL